jgi:PHP domain
MPSRPPLYDLACVVHLHSTYSDGTGTVPEIAAAARRNGLDVLLLTDHDTLEAKHRGEERWHGSVLVLVGEEVSPLGENHYLAFEIDEKIDHRGLTPAQICEAVSARGGFGFAAHPFSRGSKRFRRPPMPWRDLECKALHGIELWSFVTDAAEKIGTVREALRFILRPELIVDHPPQRNLAEWDRLCASRRTVAIGGLDAHQFGKRIAGRVPLRLMSYARSFRHLHTHVLCEMAPTGEVAHDRAQVYAALRAGRCYLAMDSVAPARGFTFWAEGPGGPLPMGAEEAAGDWTLHARVPLDARLRLIRDGRDVARADGSALEHRVEKPGAYRVEARREAHGAARTWILSNPIYLR